MSKAKKLALLCLLLALSIWIGWKVQRNRRIESGFELVKVGDSPADVIAAMGKPNEIEPCNTFLPGNIPAKCQVEFLYKDSFAPIVPEYFIIHFDSGGRVLERIPLSSP